MKYEIIHMEKNGKREERKICVMTTENLIELYKLLEKSEIKHIIEIKEVENG